MFNYYIFYVRENNLNKAFFGQVKTLINILQANVCSPNYIVLILSTMYYTISNVVILTNKRFGTVTKVHTIWHDNRIFVLKLVLFYKTQNSRGYSIPFKLICNFINTFTTLEQNHKWMKWNNKWTHHNFQLSSCPLCYILG